MPDVSFIRTDRLPEGELWPGTVPIVPDFAIEVASPGDTRAEIRRRGQRYLDAGVRLVWLVWPAQRAVSVLHPGGTEMMFSSADVLDGEEVIPGFRLAVATMFGD